LNFRFAGVGPAIRVQRQIARTLLVLLLVGVFAPVGLAMSAIPPHACCMRKMHQGSSQQQEFQAWHCANHDCCRGMMVPQSAVQPRQSSAHTLNNSVRFRTASPTVHAASAFHSSYSGRGPPAGFPNL
jgi:hypothetical protein